MHYSGPGPRTLGRQGLRVARPPASFPKSPAPASQAPGAPKQQGPEVARREPGCARRATACEARRSPGLRAARACGCGSGPGRGRREGAEKEAGAAETRGTGGLRPRRGFESPRLPADSPRLPASASPSVHASGAAALPGKLWGFEPKVSGDLG
ncbi:PREDICTED: rho GTPase-activating protein SYDE1-like [Cercocebus atys]|uniref:rho GTPase-activating protein SYDE1-like n=1 Tax=Cercocebus atys TaxID=9531 RepID=UPI0005F3D2DB|nr:PREDICTED: rho GTPase-activating protein SYDE1-like [Cercocebus atys]